MTARFRFYGELNDFLPQERRGREYCALCARAATAKHMVEALGVPHTEVATVLVNGEASGLDKMLQHGDVLSVYQHGSTPDGVELPSLSAPPPGRARFIADAHLGGLARMLRMAGFDTLYDHQLDDPDIAAIAEQQHRIVLTRDRDLLKRRNVAHGCYVRALKAPQQLKEIMERLGLQAQAAPFTLCLHCNVPLQPVAKTCVEHALPPAVRAAQHAFMRCNACGGIFWQGSHWKRMCAVLALAQCASGPQGGPA